MFAWPRSLLVGVLAAAIALIPIVATAADSREIDLGGFVAAVPTTWSPSPKLGRLARQAETAAAELARAFNTAPQQDLAPLRIYDAPGGRVHLFIAIVNLPRNAERVLAATLATTPKWAGESPATVIGPAPTTVGNQPGITVAAESAAGDKVTLLLFGLPANDKQLGAVAFWVEAGAEDNTATDRAAIVASIHFSAAREAPSSEDAPLTGWQLEIQEVLWGSGTAETVVAVLQGAALLIILFGLNFFVLLQLAYAALRRFARARRPDHEGELSDDQLPIRKEYLIFPCALLSITSTAWMVFLLVG